MRHIQHLPLPSPKCQSLFVRPCRVLSGDAHVELEREAAISSLEAAADGRCEGPHGVVTDVVVSQPETGRCTHFTPPTRGAMEGVAAANAGCGDVVGSGMLSTSGFNGRAADWSSLMAALLSRALANAMVASKGIWPFSWSLREVSD